jgi:hypothetical protein
LSEQVSGRGIWDRDWIGAAPIRGEGVRACGQREV